LITDPSELGEVEAQWDQLAVACQSPMMSPACVMAWWRHLAPATARARTVLVKEGDRLIGIAPFYIDLARRRRRRDLRLPGIEISARLAPLALPGRETDVAQGIMQAVAHSDPRPDLIALEGMPLDLNWVSDLQTHSPGRLRAWQYQIHGCPVVTLTAASFDDWLATKNSHFRQNMRRERRKFLAAGGTVRMSDITTVDTDIKTFMRLHAARWEHRGSSSLLALGAGLPAMLEDMGRTLLSQEAGRFRLQVLEVEGEPISAQLCVAAGGYVVGTVAGWDQRFARLQPGNVGMLASVEEGLTRRDQYFDLGVVDQSYKLRFTDSNAPVAWTVLMPGGLRFPQTYLSIASMVGRHTTRNALKRRLSSKQRDRYRRLRQRVHRQRPST
jgi:CelD/BcsL family acetyltransferase involved in cellulose biosynthesis